MTCAFLLCIAGGAFADDHGSMSGRRHGPRPLDTAVIGPGQEGRVMALIAPWQEGAEVVAGWRLQGASIEAARACYVFAGAAEVRVCLVAPDAVADFAGAANQRALPGGAAAVVPAAVVGDAPGAAGVSTLLDAVAAKVSANAATAGLSALWRHVEARQAVSGATNNLNRPLLWLAAWMAWMVLAAPITFARLPGGRWSYGAVLFALAVPVWDALGDVVILPRPTDLLIWLPALLIWLTIAAARSIRTLPGGGWPYVLGVLGISAATRLTLPIDAPMTAWSYTRVPRLGSLATDSHLLTTIAHDLGGLDFDDVQSALMRLVSIFTPLAILGHGRKLFGDARPALAAALLLAVSPHHLRFSASDVQFIPSMLWSSAAFLWLYQLLETRNGFNRLAQAALFAPLLWMSLTARPLNIAYAPLMLLALAMAAQMASWRWRAVVAAEIVVVAAVAAADLVASSGDAVQSAFGLETVMGALKLLFDPDYNPLLFWRLTPPPWLLLIVLGAAALIAGPWPGLPPSIARRRGLWLLGWLVGYIALHGVVIVDEPMNNARYQLHSLPAMALLAGAGWWAIWLALTARRQADQPAIWRFVAIGALTLLLLAAPWLHQGAITDVDFVTMRERAFLRRARALAPKGCTAIEVQRGRDDGPTPRLPRVLRRIGGHGDDHLHWRVVDIQRWLEAGDPDDANAANAANAFSGAPVGTLSADGLALLAAPPSCMVYFEGVTCAVGPGLPGRDPTCAAVLASGKWGLLAEERFVARVYDSGLTEPFRRNGDDVALRLWRREFEPPAR